MEPVTPQNSESDDEAGAASFQELAQFTLRAMRENAAFSAILSLGVAALGITIVSAMPVIYDATSRIFIQEGGTLTSALASGSDRYRPVEGTRGMEELILARDNLLSIVREAKLVENWPLTRPWPMRIKDELQEYLFGPASRESMERSFVDLLDKAITVAKDGESVRIHAQWRDAQGAYEVARLVQRNFLAARAANDFGPIQRAIPFLEQQLQEAEQEIENAVERLQQRAKNSASDGQALNLASSEFTSLSRRLSEIRRQQRELTEPRRAKVAELKLQLIEMRSQYSADHPLVRQQEARVASMSEVPPELSQLRDQEERILGTLASHGVKAPAPQQLGKPHFVTQDDPELAMAQARLAAALRKSDDANGKLENARIELATAEADFKHRYIVVEEPYVPDGAFKPKKRPLSFALVFLATLLAGVLGPALREFRKGRLVEIWQVRKLGLDVLGEVELE